MFTGASGELEIQVAGLDKIAHPARCAGTETFFSTALCTARLRRIEAYKANVRPGMIDADRITIENKDLIPPNGRGERCSGG